MIDKKILESFIEKTLEATDCFLVDVCISPDNRIEVTIDSDNPVDIGECERLTKAIEENFDRDKEDYELEVGSAGLTSPFRVKRQYLKYIGREVEVLGKDGKKISGVLKSAGDSSFSILSKQKVRKPDATRPVVEEMEVTFPYDEIKYTKYLLKF